MPTSVSPELGLALLLEGSNSLRCIVRGPALGRPVGLEVRRCCGALEILAPHGFLDRTEDQRRPTGEALTHLRHRGVEEVVLDDTGEQTELLCFTGREVLAHHQHVERT